MEQTHQAAIGTPFPLTLGQTFQFSKTVAECDIYLFAGLSGDFAPQHVNETYMQATPFGRRIAHGGLLVAYMSNVASQAAAASAVITRDVAVSAGYDRIRFIRPVYIGDTLTATYRVTEIHPEDRRSVAKVDLLDQQDQMVCAATHIMRWIPLLSP